LDNNINASSPDVSRSVIDLTSGYLQSTNTRLQQENARLMDTIKTLREDLGRAHADRRAFEVKMQVENDDKIARFAGEKMGRLQRDLAGAVSLARDMTQKVQTLEREVENLKMDKELLEEDFEHRSTELMRRLQEAEKPKPPPPPPPLPSSTTVFTQTDAPAGGIGSETVEELEERMGDLISETEDLHREVEELTSGKQELEREVAQLTADSESLAERRAVLAVKVSEAREAVSALAREEETLRAQREELSAARGEAQQAARDEEALLRKAQEEHRRVVDEKMQLERHTRQLRTMVDDLLADRRVLQGRMDASVRGMTDLGVEDDDEDENGFEERMFEVVDGNHEEAARVRGLLEQTQEECERLVEERERAEAAAGRMSRRVEEGEVEIAGLRRRVREMEDIVGRTRAELEGRSREIARLQEAVRRAAAEAGADRSMASVGEAVETEAGRSVQVNTSSYVSPSAMAAHAEANGDMMKQMQAQLTKMTKVMTTAKRELAEQRDEVSRLKTENIQLRIAVQNAQNKANAPSRTGTGTKTPRRAETGITRKSTGTNTTANSNASILAAEDVDNPDAIRLQLEEQMLQLRQRLDESLAECDRLRSQVAQTRKEPVTKIPKRWSGGSTGNGGSQGIGKATYPAGKMLTSGAAIVASLLDVSPPDVPFDERDEAALRVLQSQVVELQHLLDEAQTVHRIELDRVGLRLHEAQGAQKRAEERIAGLEGVIGDMEKTAAVLREEMTRKQREVDELGAWKRDELRRRESIRMAVRDRSGGASFEDHVEDALLRNLETVRTIDELCKILASQTPRKRRATPQEPNSTANNKPSAQGEATAQGTPTPVPANAMGQLLPPQTPNQAQSQYQTPEQTPTGGMEGADDNGENRGPTNPLTDLHLAQVMQGLLGALGRRIAEIVALAETEYEARAQREAEANAQANAGRRRTVAGNPETRKPARAESQLNLITSQKQAENRRLNAGHTPGPRVGPDMTGSPGSASPMGGREERKGRVGEILGVCERTVGELGRFGDVLKEYVDGNLDEAIEAGEVARRRAKEEGETQVGVVRRDMRDPGGRSFFLDGEDTARDELRREVEKLRDVLREYRAVVIFVTLQLRSRRLPKWLLHAHAHRSFPCHPSGTEPVDSRLPGDHYLASGDQRRQRKRKLRETVTRVVESWKPSDASDAEARPVLQEQLQELTNIWKHESAANTSLRNHVKELKVTTTTREEETRQQIDTLLTQVRLLNEHLLSTKTLTGEYESRWREVEGALTRERREHEARVVGFTKREAELRRELALVSGRQVDEAAGVRAELAKEREKHVREVAEAKERMEELVRVHAEKIEEMKQTNTVENRRLFTAKKGVEEKLAGMKQELNKANDRILEFEAELQAAQQRTRQLTLEKAALSKDKQRLQSELNDATEVCTMSFRICWRHLLFYLHGPMSFLRCSLSGPSFPRVGVGRPAAEPPGPRRFGEPAHAAQAWECDAGKVRDEQEVRGIERGERASRGRRKGRAGGRPKATAGDQLAERWAFDRTAEPPGDLRTGGQVSVVLFLLCVGFHLDANIMMSRWTFLSRLESELKNLREERQRASADLEETKEALELKKEECEAITEEFRSLQTLGKNMSKAGAELQVQTNRLRGELVAAQAQIATLKEELRAAREQVAQGRVEMLGVVAARHEDVLRQEIALLRDQQAELNASVRKGQLSVEAHARLYKEVQRQLEDKDRVLRDVMMNGGAPAVAAEKPRGGRKEGLEVVGSGAAGEDEIDVAKLRSELTREKRRHTEQAKEFAREARYLRAKFHRECGFRADLGYQKKYLLLLIGGLDEQATLMLITNMGIVPGGMRGVNAAKRVGGPDPGVASVVKFRRSALAVVAVMRMRMLRNSWAKSKALKPTRSATA
ncbi:hypothetical protein BC936DRAFT_137003, partial [Jimgerdemannia flammicorona]